MTGRSELPGAREVARMLAADMQGLVAELLPGARRHGREMKCGDVTGAPGKSLSVCIAGGKRGKWADFGAGIGGDALDLAAHVLFGGDKARAWRWGLRRLGYTPPGEGSEGEAPQRPQAPPAATEEAARAEADAEQRRRRALALFLEGSALTGDDPASLYLARRGIPLRALGRIPRALRFHPRCWCAETGGPLPAMLAAVTDVDGSHLATHRTYLGQDAEGWRKAPLEGPKKVLGAFAGGSVPLWRGETGRPLREAAEGEVVVISEGIENGLSVALATPELRVIAAVSLGNIGRVRLPDAVRKVIVAADNDPPGSPAALALGRALDALAEGGRAVRVAYAPSGKDFNACLTDLAAEGAPR